MPANECIPFYEPGGRLTGHCTAAVTGKRFLKISGNRTSGPGIPATAQVGSSDPTEGGNYRVAHAGAGQPSVGVSSWDSPIGAKVGIISVPGAVVPVTAGAAINVNDFVMSDANGKAVPYDSDVALSGNAEALVFPTPPLGIAMTGAANGEDAEIKLLV